MKKTLILCLPVFFGCTSTESLTVLQLYDFLAVRAGYWDAAWTEGDADTLHRLDREISANCERNEKVLIRNLNDPRHNRRVYAIFGLAFVRTTTARDALLRMLNDKSASIRSQAAASLGVQARESTPVQPLTKLLEDPDENVRQAALLGLRGVLRQGDDRGALPAILESLSDPVGKVRSEAYTVLVRLAATQTIPVLIEKGLKDDFYAARMNAATALKVMGDKAYDAVPHLIEALRDTNTEVVAAAWYALRKITGTDINRAYDNWRDWWQEEKQLYVYACPTHTTYHLDRPGSCAHCNRVLERRPAEQVKDTGSKLKTGTYVCPNHPEVKATTELICSQCGSRLKPVPKEDDKKEDE